MLVIESDASFALAASVLAVPSTSSVVVEPSLFVTVTVVLPSDDVPVVTVGE